MGPRRTLLPAKTSMVPEITKRTSDITLPSPYQRHTPLTLTPASTSPTQTLHNLPISSFLSYPLNPSPALSRTLQPARHATHPALPPPPDPDLREHPPLPPPPHKRPISCPPRPPPYRLLNLAPPWPQPRSTTQHCPRPRKRQSNRTFTPPPYTTPKPRVFC